MSVSRHWLIVACAAAALVIGSQLPAPAQLVERGLLGQVVVSPLDAGLGEYFDPDGPEPIFLDRPMTMREHLTFLRGWLRVPMNRPFTFDALGPFDPYLGDLGVTVQHPWPWGQGRIILDPAKDPSRFGHFVGPLHMPYTPPSAAPGIHWAPGRDPGRFGHFRGPLPSVLPPYIR